MYFAGRGEWDHARGAFSNRDSVRDALAAELAERKADLKDRQTADLRERQHDACDALREVRDVQYQDLLQRQRDERAAFKAGEALEAIGTGRIRHDDGKVTSQIEPAANENSAAEVTPVQRQNSEPGIETPLPERKLEPQARNEVAVTVAPDIEQVVRAEVGGHIDLSSVQLPEQETAAPARGASDLAAGAIGGVASYLADQLGELFAPTPPEVREAQATAAAKQEAERPVERPATDTQADARAAAYGRIIEEALKATEHNDAFWKERDRGKGWERDQ